MLDLIEELRRVLAHQKVDFTYQDEMLSRCFKSLVAMEKRNKELEKIRQNLLDRIDKMTHASLTKGSGKAVSVLYVEES